jgi:hypothetical protein
VSQMPWFSRTGAERTSVREHRKRRKSRQVTAIVEFTYGLKRSAAAVHGAW